MPYFLTSSHRNGLILSIPQVHLFSPSYDREFLIQYSAAIPHAYLQKFDDPYKASNCQLIITEKNIPLDTPEIIADTLFDIAKRFAPLPASSTSSLPAPPPSSPLKRKTMSDVTNCVDTPSVTESESEGKCVRVDGNEE